MVDQSARQTALYAIRYFCVGAEVEGLGAGRRGVWSSMAALEYRTLVGESMAPECWIQASCVESYLYTSYPLYYFTTIWLPGGCGEDVEKAIKSGALSWAENALKICGRF